MKKKIALAVLAASVFFSASAFASENVLAPSPVGQQQLVPYGAVSKDGYFKGIRLAGKVDAAITDAIRARGLGPNLVELGYLPHEQTVREQRAADILLLPLRQEPEYAKVLPGKIFEYLAACRPVLGIGQEQSAAATVLRDAGAGEMFDWNKTDELLAFLDVEHPQTSDIDKYSRRALTAQLIQILP